MSDPQRAARPRPFTVSEVMHQVRACLEDNFLPIFVRGEVANRSRPRSGHLYLTLRDGQSSLRVVVFASVVERSPLEFQNGDELHVWGRITAYPRSGDVQLVADRLEPAGAGAWREQKERLRKRFQAEGCFDPARKRPIPFLPRSIGVVTSPTGAAIRDVFSTLDRRFGGGLRIVVAPVKVNGLDAAPGIAEALRDLDRVGGCDVILLVRGGGSQEDLAAFDTEPVVRAVLHCTTPVVCGVGHETDVSLADLAADRRAPTPTGAAEVAIPVKRELEAVLRRAEGRLHAAALGRVRDLRQRLEHAARAHGLRVVRLRLGQARQRLADRAQRLEQASPHTLLARRREELTRAQDALERALRERLDRRPLDDAARHLARLHPGPRVQQARLDTEARAQRLEELLRRQLAERTRRLAGHTERLEGLSPLKVLARGYSLTTTEAGALVRRAADVQVGDALRVRLQEGELSAEVREVREG